MSEWYSILCLYKHIHLLYPFIYQWTIRLFPCLGYYKFCCYGHRGAWIFSRYSFFPDVCWGLELLDHMETLILFFFEERPYCFLQWLHQFPLSQQCKRVSLFSTASPASIIHQLSNDGHSDQYEVVPPCSVDLPFCTNEQCWASFHMPVGHLCIFF